MHKEVRNMYAVIQTGGKQYRVQEGDVIYVEKLSNEADEKVTFDVMLFADDEKITVGTPIVEGVSVEGKVVGHGKGEKIIVYKYKAKKNVRKKRGHRQPYTKIEITKIIGA